MISKFGYNWNVSNWGSPGSGGINTGVFSPSQVLEVSTGIMLMLDQKNTSDGKIISTGGEITSDILFSFGTFKFKLSQSSVVSGSVAAGFLYINNSLTEIDVEQQGNHPGRYDITNWQTTSKEQTSNVDGYDPTQLHEFEIDWGPGAITWKIDGRVVTTHTANIPQAPAYFIFNHWGTDNENWGGKATLDHPRILTVWDFNYAQATEFAPNPTSKRKHGKH